MKHIVLVDDDGLLLDALRVRIRRAAPNWAVTCAESGAQAIAVLQRGPCDLIVSDLRMPGMRGSRLLRAVAERWPQVIRIALSGYADDSIGQLAFSAHRYLQKPCEPPLLENAISECLRLDRLVSEPTLRAMLGRPLRLAPAREMLAKLRAVLDGNSAAVSQIAEFAGLDAVITARVLQVANSIIRSAANPTADLDEAITRLPAGTLRSLLASPEVFSEWPPKSAPAPIDFERLQQHTNQVARAARALLPGTAIAADTVTAAQLHTLGYWIMAQHYPHGLTRAVEIAAAEGCALEEAERRVFHASHAEIGAYVLGLWGLPEPVIEAIARHHDPGARGGFDATATLALAIALAQSEETDAFDRNPRGSAKVGPEFLISCSAPFTWSEAQRRVAIAEAARSA